MAARCPTGNSASPPANGNPRSPLPWCSGNSRPRPVFPLPREPRISVVVACYNAARTLQPCLDSLARLNYPDYEVVVVDDGSTDATPQIIAQHTGFRGIRQEHLGLSAARNAGIAAGTGEIVAFTDADCRADEDWLYYLAGDLLNGTPSPAWAAIISRPATIPPWPPP